MQATTRDAILASAGESEAKSKVKDKGRVSPQRQQSVDKRFALENNSLKKAWQAPNVGSNEAST
jgi:hypothetical protein